MSKKKLFSETLPVKHELFRVAEHHFKSVGVLGINEVFEHDFAFYNEDVKKSKNISKVKFTNFVKDSISSDLKARIQELSNDPTIIKSNAVTVDMNPKIHECIEQYAKIDLHSEPLIFKSSLRDMLGNPTTVRIFSKVDIVYKDDGHKKALFRIVLIDPFHLVIPSAHNGKSKEAMEEQVYNEHRGNVKCISEWLKSIFE